MGSAARTAPASPPASIATACGTARMAPMSSGVVSPLLSRELPVAPAHTGLTHPRPVHLVAMSF